MRKNYVELYENGLLDLSEAFAMAYNEWSNADQTEMDVLSKQLQSLRVYIELDYMKDHGFSFDLGYRKEA